jgi:hypothetical protein
MTIKRMVKRELRVVRNELHLERAAFIATRVKQGATYAQAIREADAMKRPATV